MDTYIKYFIEALFGFGLVFKSVLFLPQALKVYKAKDSKELSLLTFAGLNVMQLLTMLHAYLNKDYILLLGVFMSLIFCGAVTYLIILYRK
ncbi:MAG: hypothetical protein KKE11_06965 [Gammaproteobacteria bacterium]|nr:hypothetical protein [Gammaproteobacteria bacterium]